MNPQLQKLQKELGIKQGQYDNEKNRLYHQGQTLLKMVEFYIRQVEEAKLTDEQFFINWEDSINELSIKDHTASPE